MNTKEIIEKLRQTFMELTSPAEQSVISQPQKFSYKLMDGTEVEITELAVGGIVTIAGQPAPAGEHQLEDGTKIMVGENGAIMEIMPAETAPIPPAAEDMGQRFSAFENLANEKFASYESKFAHYEAKFQDYETRLGKATKVIDGLIDLTQKLAETPMGNPDPAANVVNNFTKDKVAGTPHFTNDSKKPFNYEILFTKK